MNAGVVYLPTVAAARVERLERALADADAVARSYQATARSQSRILTRAVEQLVAGGVYPDRDAALRGLGFSL